MTIELRSDTFSRPSAAMYEALQSAELGDDVYGEDPTVAALERRAAELTGKEAALLVTSGTQGNLTAVSARCRRGTR
jgi:threonine aldolase